MSSPIATAPISPAIREQDRSRRPLDRVTELANRTISAAAQTAEAVKPKVIEAGRATVKAGGIFATISAICLAIVTLLCALLFGY